MKLKRFTADVKLDESGLEIGNTTALAQYRAWKKKNAGKYYVKTLSYQNHTDRISGFHNDMLVIEYRKKTDTGTRLTIHVPNDKVLYKFIKRLNSGDIKLTSVERCLKRDLNRKDKFNPSDVDFKANLNGKKNNWISIVLKRSHHNV